MESGNLGSGVEVLHSLWQHFCKYLCLVCHSESEVTSVEYWLINNVCNATRFFVPGAEIIDFEFYPQDQCANPVEPENEKQIQIGPAKVT